MTHVLITGITGFIGSELARSLLKNGYEVFGLVRNDIFSENRIEGASYIPGDLLDRPSIGRALNSSMPDIIVHLAAYTPVRFSFHAPGKYSENYTGTMNLVEAALEHRAIKQFVAASSAEVYGPRSKRKMGTITEGACPTPLSPYAISKYSGELYVRYAGHLGLNYTILRPTNTYGRAIGLPEEARGYFIEKLIIGMLKGETLKFDGYGESVRRWLYVADHVAAYLSVIENSRAFGEIFNVSSAEGETSLLEVAEMASELAEYKSHIEWGVNPRPIDPNFLNISGGKMKRFLGWQPGIKLEAGLDMTVQYWREKIENIHTRPA
ncbi:MAG: NAD-dependent epimerase/dehydratase family protein [Nitrososphaerales archaeon]